MEGTYIYSKGGDGNYKKLLQLGTASAYNSSALANDRMLLRQVDWDKVDPFIVANTAKAIRLEYKL